MRSSGSSGSQLILDKVKYTKRNWKTRLLYANHAFIESYKFDQILFFEPPFSRLANYSEQFPRDPPFHGHPPDVVRDNGFCNGLS